MPLLANLSHEEPDAVVLHVRTCGGRGWQHPRLPGDKIGRGTANVTLDIRILDDRLVEVDDGG